MYKKVFTLFLALSLASCNYFVEEKHFFNCKSASYNYKFPLVINLSEKKILFYPPFGVEEVYQICSETEVLITARQIGIPVEELDCKNLKEIENLKEKTSILLKQIKTHP